MYLRATGRTCVTICFTIRSTNRNILSCAHTVFAWAFAITRYQYVPAISAKIFIIRIELDALAYPFQAIK